MATLDYLRSHNLPVPEVYDYSSNAANSAETAYTFLEFMRGTNLGDVWFELGERARLEVVRRLVEMENRLFTLSFPASASLYYTKDLDRAETRYELPSPVGERGPLCIGPETTLAMWYGKRSDIETSRGPCRATLLIQRHRKWRVIGTQFILTLSRPNSDRSDDLWCAEREGILG